MVINPYINTSLGSCLIIVLVAIDYLRKYNTDIFQRKLLIVFLGTIFITTILDFIGLTLEGKEGKHITIILYLVWSVYMISRNLCYYYAAVFIDYFTHGNSARTKKFFKIATCFIFIYSISIIFNLRYEFYFYISANNSYTSGNLYLLQILISYFPIVIAIIDISLVPRNINQNQVVLTIIFIIITAIGAAFDVILKTTNLIWPCMTGALLYIYFFIIKSDSKIDSLTGIGNRNSFNEYIDALSKQTEKKDYLFILFDLDLFKEINDTLGHLEGDNALRDAAMLIKSCIRYTDFAARFGGDEFILVIPEGSDVTRLIDRIKNAFNAQNRKKIRPYQLYISYGYDIFTTNSELSIQDFLTQIDKKMYQYKAAQKANLTSAITANIK